MIDRYLNITNMYIKLWSDALCVKQIIIFYSPQTNFYSYNLKLFQLNNTKYYWLTWL